MDAKDFGQLLKDHPEILDNPKKFAAILRDVYPREKGNVNLMITSYNAGVVSILRDSALDSLLISRIMTILMDDYNIAENKARWAAELWCNAYCFCASKVLIPKPVLKYLEVEKTSGGYSITGYNRDLLPKDGRIIIPNGITSIGDWAFIGCKNLTSINLPDSITSIGTGAFRDCKNLIIHCSTGFYAERYAKENRISFRAI